MSAQDHAAPSGRAAPVAVVGLACRFPQAPDPDGFWRLLRLGRDAVGAMPADRGASRAWPGGFLGDVASFDAEFFGISPREAVATDPQQRLMLELAWEAMEDAGVRPASLAGSGAGVFVGAIWDDYAALLRRSRLDGSARHAMTGVHRGIIANRVSYTYDLRGPSLHIDTAQSSSLVAVHMAAESLRRGECPLALAGGVNLILADDSMEMAAGFGGLSPDGRCRTFDAGANGFVRGEGGGAVLLKPLDAALRDGDRVHCVVLGGAVNNDGGTDALTVPSVAAQEEMLREAYRAAGAAPGDVQYVELHGSGTPVGDPVEAAALGAVLGAGRPAGSPLPVGSVKTNIGHLEGAGGIAGLIKTALSLRHRRLPASLNFSTPNPRIPLARLGLRVQDGLSAWPHPDRPLLAGVSSFGMGGTNCHLVLGSAPDPGPDAVRAPAGPAADVPWPLSGASPAALAAQAGRLRRHLAERPDSDPVDVGYSLGVTRTAFPHRAVVFGEDAEERLRLLDALERGADAPGLVRGRASDGRAAVLLGQGTAAGGALAEAFPRFAEALDETCALLDPHLERPLREAAFTGDASGDAPDAQAAAFALDVALYRLAESWGLAPDFVLGRAAGAVAAAHVAGALPLGDACALLLARARAAEAPDALGGVVAGLSLSAPAIPLVSGASGLPATVEQLASPDYWAVGGDRETTPGIRYLEDNGVTTFLQLGPDARLAAAARESLAGRTSAPLVVEAMREDMPETVAFTAAMACLHARGADLDWEAVFAGRRGRRVALPTYAFQRTRYWPDVAADRAPRPEPVAAPPSRSPEPPVRDESSPFTRRLAALPGADRERELLDTVRTHVAHILGHTAPGDVDPGLTFKQLGLDSIAGTELSKVLGTATGLTLPTTLTYDHPSPNAVAKHLGDRILRAPVTVPDRRDADEPASDDPVAIVGMACRYPGGVASPEDLWDLVASGSDAVGEFPENRGWNLSELFDPDPERSGHSYTSAGGFLHDADLFDASFFGISPREAVAMDPQQRLLLETSWQALERAGIDPSALHGTPTGVVVGATGQDYGPRMHEASDDLDGQLLTGTAPSVMAGRVAFTLGLEGPAVTVDTACSSSLVAMHLACRSLRQGECSLALAGGVTVMATPGMFVEFSRQRGLAPDGRCKAFAASADGTGWAEGVGMVVLERLSDARRNGHRVLAVVRGSAVNQDGASNGLTAPNGPSQERLIRRALADAGLAAADVDAVEAHGTGTTLGDPIEAGALLAAYGRDRPAGRPLWLGTVKSNLGHTQAAAGAAGVIKTVMAMRHGVLPATLHVDEPTPHVDWSPGSVRLLTEPVDWPETGRPRRAAVSSFGISGTNAHLILEQAPDRRGPEPDAPPWIVSARSPKALRDQAARLAGFVAARGELTAAEVGWSLITTRSVFEHRAVVLGRDRARLLAGLAALADGEPDADVVTGAARASGAAPVLVFPGQGTQWPGMGAELLESWPVFAARVAECERALAPHVDWSLTGVLRGGGDELSRVDVVQPVLWAVMVSLAAVWAEYGVAPGAVVGHSQGEIAAACVAGALSLEDGARVVAVRARALRRLSGQGAMASVAAGPDRVARLVGPHAGVTVAAVNGPSSTVVSGPPDQVAAAVAAAREQGVRARAIDVDYASHGPQVDEITGELRAELAGVAPVAAEVPFYSTVTAQRVDTTTLDADYWAANLRRPVRFADAVAVMLGDGHRVFVESSPHPVLAPGIEESAEEAGVPAAALPTLHRDRGGPDQVARALARAFTAGADVDWTRSCPADPPPRVVDLPTYAFQRERYWLPAAARDAADRVDPGDLGLSATGHPVLGAALEPVDGDGRVLTGRVSKRRQPWLADHVIGGALLVPGAAQLEWALRAADEAGCAAVEELVVHTPLAVPVPDGADVRAVVGAPDRDGRREVGLYSRAGSGWTRHATGVLGAAPNGLVESPAAWPPAGAEPVDLTGFYDATAAAGYDYGPAFQGLRALWRDGRDLFAEVELPEDVHADAGFGVHPALLDAALHPVLAGRLDDGGGLWLPFTWTDVTLHAVGARAVRVGLSMLGDGLDQGVRLTVADPAGGPVLNAVVTLRQAGVERLRDAAEHAGTARDANGGVPRRPAAASAGRPDDWARGLAGLAAEERRGKALDVVRGHSAAVLGHTGPAGIDPDATFTEMGLGSVMAVELRERLVAATGLALPAAVVFGHPTPRALASELLRRAAADGGAARGGGNGAGPLLDELARLESALAGADPGGGDHDAVAARLERLAETWRRTRAAANGNGAGGRADGEAENADNAEDAADRLRSASTEQVFDFIDNELGVS